MIRLAINIVSIVKKTVNWVNFKLNISKLNKSTRTKYASKSRTFRTSEEITEIINERGNHYEHIYIGI